MSIPVNNNLPGSTLEQEDPLAGSEFQAGVEVSKTTHLERSAFVKQIMHPPSAEPNFIGWPSMDSRSQVIMRNSFMNLYKQRLVATGANRTAVAVSDAVDFNIGFLMLPSLRNLVVGWTQNAAGIVTQDVANTFDNDVANWNNFSSDVNLFRVIAKSTTFEPNMTAFNNQGTVVACQFNPALLFSGTLTQFVEQMPSHAAAFIATNIIDRQINPSRMDVWELVTDHMHHIIQTRCARANYKLPSLVELRVQDLDKKLSLDPNELIQVLNLGDAPLTGFPSTSQILNMSTRSYSNLARDGCFLVQRPNKLEPKWNTAGRTGGSGDLVPRLYQCWLYTTYNASTFIPLLDQTTLGSNAPILYDALWTTDLTAGWVKFEGLSINTSLSGTSARQLIAIKSFVVAEYQPAAISPYSGLQRLSPVPDLKSIEDLMRDFYTLKDALPACCNSWGALASVVGPHLLKFGSELVKNMFGPKTSAKPKKTVRKEEKKVIKDLAKLDLRTKERPSRSRTPRNVVPRSLVYTNSAARAPRLPRRPPTPKKIVETEIIERRPRSARSKSVPSRTARRVKYEVD